MGIENSIELTEEIFSYKSSRSVLLKPRYPIILYLLGLPYLSDLLFANLR
jgi:hypothetical protein